MDYEADSSGGLMPQILALTAPPGSHQNIDDFGNSSDIGLAAHPYFRRPGKGHNHDLCDACGEGGDLICCDFCPASFHLTCHDPPLDEEELPTGCWSCHQCRIGIVVDDKTGASDGNSKTSKMLKNGKKKEAKTKDGSKEKVISSGREIEITDNPMTTLIRAAAAINPTQFSLPYEMTLPITFPGEPKENLPRKNARKGINNKKRSYELDNGIVPLPAKLCFQCSKSCRVGPMIPCDYCPLFFHLDCLDPPLTTPPMTLWMCPTHPEHHLDANLLSSHSLTERVKLWDRFTPPVDAETIKLDFFRKCHRKNPPFRFKVKKVMRSRIRVPNSIKSMYENPRSLFPQTHSSASYLPFPEPVDSCESLFPHINFKSQLNAASRVLDFRGKDDNFNSMKSDSKFEVMGDDGYLNSKESDCSGKFKEKNGILNSKEVDIAFKGFIENFNKKSDSIAVDSMSQKKGSDCIENSIVTSISTQSSEIERSSTENTNSSRIYSPELGSKSSDISCGFKTASSLEFESKSSRSDISCSSRVLNYSPELGSRSFKSDISSEGVAEILCSLDTRSIPASKNYARETDSISNKSSSSITSIFGVNFDTKLNDGDKIEKYTSLVDTKIEKSTSLIGTKQNTAHKNGKKPKLIFPVDREKSTALTDKEENTFLINKNEKVGSLVESEKEEKAAGLVDKKETSETEEKSTSLVDAEDFTFSTLSIEEKLAILDNGTTESVIEVATLLNDSLTSENSDKFEGFDVEMKSVESEVKGTAVESDIKIDNSFEGQGAVKECSEQLQKDPPGKDFEEENASKSEKFFEITKPVTFVDTDVKTELKETHLEERDKTQKVENFANDTREEKNPVNSKENETHLGASNDVNAKDTLLEPMEIFQENDPSSLRHDGDILDPADRVDCSNGFGNSECGLGIDFKPTQEERNEWLANLVHMQTNITRHMMLNEKNATPDIMSNEKIVNQPMEIDEPVKTKSTNFTANYKDAKEKKTIEEKPNLTKKFGITEKQLVKLKEFLRRSIDSGGGVGDSEVAFNEVDEVVIKLLAFEKLKQVVKPKCLVTPNIPARALLCPLPLDVSTKVFTHTEEYSLTPAPMVFRVLNVGTGSQNHVNLELFGRCNYVSNKHATIIFDEFTGYYELLNYSVHGTVVDNIPYTFQPKEETISRPSRLPTTEKIREIITNRRKVYNDKWRSTNEKDCSNFSVTSENKSTNDEKFDNETGTKDPEMMNSHPGQKFTRCNCQMSQENREELEGWEGAAILHHGSLLEFGCLKFVFSIIEEANRGDWYRTTSTYDRFLINEVKGKKSPQAESESKEEGKEQKKSVKRERFDYSLLYKFGLVESRAARTCKLKHMEKTREMDLKRKQRQMMYKNKKIKGSEAVKQGDERDDMNDTKQSDINMKQSDSHKMKHAVNKGKHQGILKVKKKVKKQLSYTDKCKENGKYFFSKNDQFSQKDIVIYKNARVYLKKDLKNPKMIQKISKINTNTSKSELLSQLQKKCIVSVKKMENKRKCPDEWPETSDKKPCLKKMKTGLNPKKKLKLKKQKTIIKDKSLVFKKIGENPKKSE